MKKLVNTIFFLFFTLLLGAQEIKKTSDSLTVHSVVPQIVISNTKSDLKETHLPKQEVLMFSTNIMNTNIIDTISSKKKKNIITPYKIDEN